MINIPMILKNWICGVFEGGNLHFKKVKPSRKAKVFYLYDNR